MFSFASLFYIYNKILLSTVFLPPIVLPSNTYKRVKLFRALYINNINFNCRMAVPINVNM